MLKPIVRDHVIQFFDSEQWKDLLADLDKGWEVLHAHLYCESIISPFDMAEIVEGYFDKRGLPLQRDIRILSNGRGVGNVYNVHPQVDMAHFEIFMTYNKDTVIGPARPKNSRGGKRTYESWTKDYMSDYYSSLGYRQPSDAEREEIEAYFYSDHWRQAYEFMTEYRARHCHVPVATSIHPEIISQIGAEVIARKGWEVAKVVPCVFPMRKFDQGKTVYLLARPEVVVELEWEYEPETVIRPRTDGLIRITTEEIVERELHGYDYYPLTDLDKEYIVSRI